MENYTPQANDIRLSSSATSFLPRTRTLSKALIYAALITFALAAAPALQAQTCDNIPNPGTESLSAKVSVNGVQVTDGMVVPHWSTLRIDSVITATGSCTGMGWTNTNPSTCVPTGLSGSAFPITRRLRLKLTPEQNS